MALQRSIAGVHPMLLVLLFTVAVLLAMAALTAVLGISVPGPSFDSVPDPAGALPF